MRRRTLFPPLVLAVASLPPLFACSERPVPPSAPGEVQDDPRGDDPPGDETTEGGAGRFRRLETARYDERLSPEQREQVARLEAMGYASGSALAGTLAGVTRHDPERAYAGTNVYTSGHASEAVLIDMQGRVLHRWGVAFEEVWPDEVVEGTETTDYWRRAYVSPNGDVLAIFAGLGLVKLDARSNVLWSTANRAHHDLQILPDGRIWVLTRTAHLVPRFDPEQPVLEDFAVLLDADGRELRRVSLLEAAEASEFAEHLERSRGGNGDLFHTNSIEILDGRIADRVPEFAAGNALISILKWNAIAVVDLEAGRFVWLLRGDFRRQHDPKVLANGHLMLFDNGGRRPYSRVLELDPASGEVLWQYAGSEAEPFHSQWCGIAQRLPNGNTLVTETDQGRAFEVTSEGDIVWEFFNPNRAGEQDELIASLFEVERLPPDFPLDWASEVGR